MECLAALLAAAEAPQEDEEGSTAPEAASHGALELSPLSAGDGAVRPRRRRRGEGGSTGSVGSQGAPGAPAAFSPPPPASYLVSHTRKFEVADLFAFLLGPRARVWYVAVLSGYMYGALWAYGTVFASSFSANVPVVFFNGGRTCDIERERAACLPSFMTWLAVFAAAAIPLACMELAEQVVTQVVMFGARVLVVLLMTGTVVAGWGCGGGGVVFAPAAGASNATAGGGSPALGPGLPPGLSLFNVGGLPALLPVATYAFIFHHSVPVLAAPVADKASLPSLFRTAFLVCCAAYGALGLVVALGFGSGISAQCNLNWQTYVGCVAARAGGVGAGDAPLPAAAIRFVILIFPALDVLSAYPLNAITLGNNLMAACLGEAALVAAGAAPPGASGPSSAAAAAPPAAGGAWYLATPTLRFATRTVFRLLAAAPPIVAGALSTSSGINLDTILRWTGLIGVAIAFLIPALLRAAAVARCRMAFAALSARASGGEEGAAEAGLPAAAEEGAPLKGPPVGGGGGAEEELRAALTAPLGWRALLRGGGAAGGAPAGWDEQKWAAAVGATPYTSWAVAGARRGDIAMFFFSIFMAAYVFWGLATNKT